MRSDLASEKALTIQNKAPWKRCGAFPLCQMMGKTNHTLKKTAGLEHGHS
ncbi:hypothetical protein [uncultured Methanolobus sp.]|nr:hypothetical protein [uncultured Methanolobus sp.]